jgi:hypothetical protein
VLFGGAMVAANALLLLTSRRLREIGQASRENANSVV